MKYLHVLFTIVMIFIVSSISAQIVKISAFGQEGFVMGDMTNKEINSGTAGYVEFASSAGLEAAYYLKNNIGFGLRWSGTNYGRDYESYESDLTEMLGITSDQYDITQSYAYWSVGTDLGISYMLDLSEKWQLEPYFYLGFNVLTSPMSSVLFSENNTTYQYRSKSQVYFGFCYSPGLKFNWNPFTRAGFYFSLEYNGNSYLEEDERSMIYSYNTLDITDTEKTYKIQSLNIGLGFAVRLGKGTEQ